MTISRQAINHFGCIDATLAESSEISGQHISLDVQQRLKRLGREDGKQIIVGIKGSGKTDLRRFIALEDKDALVLNISSDTSYIDIDTTATSMTSGRIKNALALLLLEEFRNRAIRSESRATQAVAKLKKAGTKTKDILKNIPEGVDINTPFGSIDLGVLYSSPPGIVSDAWTAFAAEVKAALSSRRGYILIDDIDDILEGIAKNPTLIEGLCRSVREINRQLGNRLHALIFMKHGLWRSWYENPQEYDKVADVIEFNSWNDALLVALVSRRIAWRHNINTEDRSEEDLWRIEFEFDDFPSFSKRFTEICVSGPRDVIYVCNKCAEAAGNKRITLQDLERALPEYSENKLFQIKADFGVVYDRIHEFVPQVLRNAPIEMDFESMAQLIEERSLLKDEVRREYRNYEWFRLSDREKLVDLMYRIGVAGIVENGKIVYVIEEPNRKITSDDTLVIHPAFRPILRCF